MTVTESIRGTEGGRAGALPCGCERGKRGMAVLCEAGAALKAETKAAGNTSNDPKIKGGAKVKLCREFDRKRAIFHAHIGLGAR